jgi:hypothetical protein
MKLKINKTDLFSLFIIFFMLVSAYFFIHNNSHFGLKCIISSADGEKYCIRDRNRLQEAASLLALIRENSKKVVAGLYKEYPKNSFVQQLKNRFNPKVFQETLPTSVHTAYSENKGEKMAFCLNKKPDNDEHLIDKNTLMFVALHELTHIGTEEIGHTQQYWENFKFVLEYAVKERFYIPIDYKKNPEPYCGMTISDNPYYDLE